MWIHMKQWKVVVSKLHKEYGIGTSVQYNIIVLVGDQKTYSRIHELKQIYGSDLD